MNFSERHSGSRRRAWLRARAVRRDSWPPLACWGRAHLSSSGCWNECFYSTDGNCKAGVGDPHPPWQDPFGRFRRKPDFRKFDEEEWRVGNEQALPPSSGLIRHWSCWPYNFDFVAAAWHSCFDRDSHCKYRYLLNSLSPPRTAMRS